MLMSNRPKNTNTNALIGNSLGPVVYRLKSGEGNQYVFLNPSTMANLLGVNVNNLNRTLNNKGNNNVFEKLHGVYGRSPVQNPFRRGNIKRSNIVKMNGPTNPITVPLNFNKEKAKRNANKLKAMLEKQRRVVERREERERRQQEQRQERERRRQRRQQNNNQRELETRTRYENNLRRLVTEMTVNRAPRLSAWNAMQSMMNDRRRQNFVSQLSANYESYKQLGKTLRTTSPFSIIQQRRLRQQMATLRTKMQNTVKTLTGNSISRLNNIAFKNKVYYVIRSNGKPMSVTALNIYRRWGIYPSGFRNLIS